MLNAKRRWDFRFSILPFSERVLSFMSLPKGIYLVHLDSSRPITARDSPSVYKKGEFSLNQPSEPFHLWVRSRTHWFSSCFPSRSLSLEDIEKWCTRSSSLLRGSVYLSHSYDLPSQTPSDLLLGNRPKTTAKGFGYNVLHVFKREIRLIL